MKEGVSAMARLFLFIPFPVETWRAASLCIKYFINQCICVLRNINHSFIIVYIINQCICALPYKTFTYILLNIHIYRDAARHVSTCVCGNDV